MWLWQGEGAEQKLQTLYTCQILLLLLFLPLLLLLFLQLLLVAVK